jgi:hypothetical protein
VENGDTCLLVGNYLTIYILFCDISLNAINTWWLFGRVCSSIFVDVEIHT